MVVGLPHPLYKQSMQTPSNTDATPITLKDGTFRNDVVSQYGGYGTVED